MLDFTAAERCRELVELGPQAYRRALGEAVYVTAVEETETATNTLDNRLSLNTRTHNDYKISGGKHDVVTEQLLSRCSRSWRQKESRVERRAKSRKESRVEGLVKRQRRVENRV